MLSVSYVHRKYDVVPDGLPGNGVAIPFAQMRYSRGASISREETALGVAQHPRARVDGIHRVVNVREPDANFHLGVARYWCLRIRAVGKRQ